MFLCWCPSLSILVLKTEAHVLVKRVQLHKALSIKETDAMFLLYRLLWDYVMPLKNGLPA